MSGTFAIVAGGGTAGHVLPGVAVARELERRGHGVHVVGAERGIEARLLPAEGLDHTLLPGRGIQRSLAPAAIVANVRALVGLTRAAFTAVGLVRRLRPKVVLALGGYASFPCVAGALLWRVPVVVAEQNVHPGAANRFAGRFARACAVAFPGTPLPRAVVTGNPVRPEVLAADRSPAGQQAARAELGIPSGRQVVLVAGGSLGARSINEATTALVAVWSGRDDLAVRHVVGRRDWDLAAGPAPERLHYERIDYEDRMPLALAAADVGVFRSGSGTCFEVAAVGLPAVLVPSPYVTGDHQTANARWLADAGGAVLVPDGEVTGERLATEVDGLLGDPDRRAAMAAALATLARPDAAGAIVDLLEQHARG